MKSHLDHHTEDLKYASDNEKYEAPKGKKKVQRTMITNTGDATGCPERKAGKCQVDKFRYKNGKKCRCYAELAEIQYWKTCPAYRREQKRQFNTYTAMWYSDKIAGIQSRARRKFTHHRWNEAGGLRDTKDLLKIAQVSDNVAKIGMKSFLYTSDDDIWNDWKALGIETELVVNGSGFMADNEYRVVDPEYKAQKNEYWCLDKCYNCRMCKEKLGITILSVARHQQS